MSLIKTEALVIKTSDYSESTYLVTLFSPDYGRIRVLAKGAKRVKSQNRGALEPFSRIQATMYLKEPTGLGTLKESAPVVTAATLRNDYDRWLLASLVLEIIDKATLPGDDFRDLFVLACSYLEEIQSAVHPEETTIAVLGSILTWFGYGLAFDRCGICGGGKSFSGFLIGRASVICTDCAGVDKQYRSLPSGTIKVFECLVQPNNLMRKKLRTSSSQIEQIFTLLVDLLQYHLEISLSSARMRKENVPSQTSCQES